MAIPNIPREFLFRGLAFGTTTLFFSTYPLYIFLVYMAANGFYAYEMPENFFSLKVFFLTAFITLALIGVASLFSLFEIVPTYRKLGQMEQPPSRFTRLWQAVKNNIWLALGNLGLWLLLALFALTAKDHSFVTAIVVSLLLGVLILTIVFATARGYFFTLAAYVTFAFLHPLLDQSISSELLEIGLRRFNVGSTDVELIEGGKNTSGRLIFLSPSHVYVKLKSDDRMAIIPRTDAITISYTAKPKQPRPE